MKMIEMKIDDLAGVALDYAIACSLAEPEIHDLYGVDMVGAVEPGVNFKPSTDWAQGGPLLDKFPWALPHRATPQRHHLGAYQANTPGDLPHNGPTPLIAACRAIAIAHFGLTIQVPEEMLP